MSKIDEYTKIKTRNNQMIRDLEMAANAANDSHNDKASLCFHETKIWDTDLVVAFHASHGFYGSSSGYSDCSPEMRPYLVKALNTYIYSVYDMMKQLMAADIAKALLAAEDEAKEIMAKIDKEKDDGSR